MPAAWQTRLGTLPVVHECNISESILVMLKGCLDVAFVMILVFVLISVVPPKSKQGIYDSQWSADFSVHYIVRSFARVPAVGFTLCACNGPSSPLVRAIRS